MKDANKYMLLFFILNLNCVTFSIWAMFYPYYASFVKDAIPTMTMKEMFAYTIFQYFGYTIGSSFMSFSLFLFGYKGSLMLIGILNFLHCAWGVMFVNKLSVILSVAFTGMIRQCISVLTILFFTERMTEGAAVCYSKPLGGTALGSFIWALVLDYMVNPNNEDLSLVIVENGQTNKYYSRAVADRVYDFYMFHGVVALLVFLVVYIYIPQSQKFKGRFFEVVGILKNPNMSISKSYASFKNELNDSIMSGGKTNQVVMMPVGNSRVYNASINNSKRNITGMSIGSKSFDESLVRKVELKETKKDLEKQAENDVVASDEEEHNGDENSIRSELTSLPFWIIFIISIIRNSETAFMVDNYKLQGIQIVGNDKLLNQAYAISGVVSLFIRSYAGALWERFGFLECYTAAIMGSFFLDFLYLTYIENFPNLFLVTTIFARCLYAFNNIMNYLTLYTLYPPEKALKLSIIYDIHFFISIVVTIMFNSYFVDDMNFKPVYGSYLMLDVAALVMLFMFIRPWVSRNRSSY